MFTSIFQSLSTGLGELLDSFINLFLDALRMDLGAYLKIFPFLGTVYSILQAMAFGLIAVIAGRHLALFWLGSFDSSVMQERPVSILLRSFIAAIGVYFGGYILSFLTKWGAIPYETFRAQSAANNSMSGIGITAKLGAGLLEIQASPTAALADLTIAMMELLFLILIAWNVFKLTIEVGERYMMVGILVFTSPIIYPTLASKESAQIFKKWCSMFIGSLIMMSASVVFLKLIVSGLNNLDTKSGLLGLTPATEFFLRMLLILATCKIAQRVDSYLQQLGIGVATTGGSMADDILALAHSARRLASSGGHGKGVLGEVAARTPLGRGVKKAVSDYGAGASAKDAAKAGFAAGRAAYERNTGLGSAFAAGRAASAHNATAPDGKKKNVAAEMGKGFVKGTANGAVSAVAPNVKTAHDGVKTGEQERKEAEAAAKEAMSATKTAATGNAEAEAAMRKDFAKGGNSDAMPDDLRDAAKAAQDGDMSRLRNADANYEQFGSTDKNGNTFALDADGDPKATLEAAASGVGINENDVVTDKVGGRAVSDWLAQANSAAGTDASGDSKYGIGSRADYINKQRAADVDQVNNFQSTPYLGHNDLKRAADADSLAYERAVASGASADVIAAAARKAEDSRSALYAANVEAGQKRIDEAEKAMNEAKPNSREYRDAEREYKQAQSSLSSYQEAYARVNADTFSSANRAVVDSFQESVPNSDRLRANVRQAENTVSALRNSGASEAQIEAAEQRLSSASEEMHQAAISYGSQSVADARERMSHAEPSSADYKEAEREYRRAQEAFSSYQSAYSSQSRESGHSPYDEMASENYDSARTYMNGVMGHTIDAADTYTKVRALENPHYQMIDNDNTRRIATDVFREAIPDMKEDTRFSSVNIRDLPARSDNPGNIEMNGGRVIEVEYIRTDGTTGHRSFYDGRAATSLDSSSSLGFSEGKSIFKSADGTQWVTDGSQHISAAQTGKQIRETNSIRNWFALFRKRNS